ncbi:hypothetical protein [Nostoc sp. C110]
MQPYCALAIGLRRAGHEVTNGECKRFATSVCDQGSST